MSFLRRFNPLFFAVVAYGVLCFFVLLKLAAWVLALASHN